MLFPDSFIINDFLMPDELLSLRDLFKTTRSEFQYGHNEDGSLSLVCRTHQLLQETSNVPWLKIKFEASFQNLCESLKLDKDLHQMLSFKKFFFKFYLKNDYYGKHVDSSECNLSFLYQFSSGGADTSFSDLVFEDGERIPFRSNQMIIFQSMRPHSFSNNESDKNQDLYKCLVQCLPEFS
jgi:hypothetical protein